MKIAIFSDIHDNIWKLEKALSQAQGMDGLIFCGDFCAPFTMEQIGVGFAKPIHVVFGNNDGDRYLLTKIAAKFDPITMHGEFAEFSMGGLRIGVNHYPEIARRVAASGQFDAVFYGHNHVSNIQKIGHCDFINPGEIMGRFGKSTFVVFDTSTRQSQIIVI